MRVFRLLIQVVFIHEPKISIALALSLGMTSSGEIVEFENHTRMNLDEFTEKLKAQIPADLPIYEVKELPLKSQKATQILDTAEYTVTISAGENTFTPSQWQSWIDDVINTDEIMFEKKMKPNKKTSTW